MGRGLHLVESLGRWGAEPVTKDGRTVGKVVWFRPTETAAAGADDGPAPGSARARSGAPADDSPAPFPPAGPPVSFPAPTPRGVDSRGVLGRYAFGELVTATAADRRPPARCLIAVRLLNFPLRVFADVRDHHDEVMREFALLWLQRESPGGAGTPLPARLAELVDLLGRRYGAAADRRHAPRDAALARGDLAADLTYHVPHDAADEIARLAALLAEAETYCADGWLLTLPSTPLQRAFVQWFTAEFLRQREGGPPLPWDGPLVPEDAMPSSL